MRSTSDQLLLMLPPVFGLLLALLFAAPMHAGGWPIAPNVGFLMTLTVVAVYPSAWPRWFAFLFGLLQDILFGTPLGSQALLMLLLISIARLQARRGFQQFRLRWPEAAGVLLIAHGLLWVLCHVAGLDGPPLRVLAHAAVTSTVWYPIFYFCVSKWNPTN